MSEISGPNLHHEKSARDRGFHRVIGLDEAGRGPWAGPVVAAAAWIDPDASLEGALSGLNDSKKLSISKREAIFAAMEESPSVIFAVASASVEEIDRLNILAASFLAMRRAFSTIPFQVDYALVDGNRLPDLPCPGEALVKGDARALSIAAASIAAKVTRDREMARLAESFPAYGWERNQGYGTKIHQEALQSVGPSPHHRRSFKPVAAFFAPDT